MFRKVLVFASLIIVLSLSINTSALAQKSQPLSQPFASQPMEQAPVGAVGQSGLSYRYVQSFGTTEVPYIVDTTHLNRPSNLFMDQSTDSLYVTEENGSRLLKYGSDKTNLLAIGKAGVNYTDDYVFNQLQDITLDPDGNIWGADAHRLVEYSQTGEFLRNFPSTDPWQSGTDHGRFQNPSGLAFDGLGHLFVADRDNQRVEVFNWTSGNDPTYLTTIGVTGESGSGLDHLNQPYRVEVKADGTMFILDYGNNRVLSCPFDSIGNSWTCSALVSDLNNPRGLALGPTGALFIADTENGQVIKCEGTVCTALITDRWFYDLAIDSTGNVYGAQPWECQILKYDSTGSFVENYLGVTSTCYLTDSAHFNKPRVAIDAENNMLVLEESGHRLLKFSPSGTLLWEFGQAGHDVNDNDHLNSPHGLDTDPSGNIYVADNYRVQIFNKNGVYQSTIGTVTSWDPARIFGWVTDVAVDPNNGTIYVSDAPNHVVWVYNSAHSLVGQIGTAGQCITGNLGICYPLGLDVDANSNVYISDPGNNTIQKYNSQRQYLMSIGTPGPSGNQHGQFVYPETVSVDPQGRAFVADWNNNRVEVFDATSAYLATIGGNWGTRPGDFRGTSDVSIDSSGNVYVSDYTNGRIQKFSPGVPGWKQTNINGFGDQYNVLGVTNVFNGKLYTGVTKWGAPPQIWQSGDGKNWSMVSTPGNTISNAVAAVLDLISFNGQMYASLGWNADTQASIWRTANGTDWNAVTTDGFGHSGPSSNADTMTVYGGNLYAAIGSGAPTDGIGVFIYRSSSGDPGSWSPVVTNGNGNVKNTLIGAFAEFKGALYACGKNADLGAFIWKSSPDGSTWSQVGSYGLDASQQDEAITLAVLNEKLYVGTFNGDSGKPGQIWSSSDGTTWSPVIQDGFGDANNIEVISLYEFDDALYAITGGNESTGSQIWKSQNGVNWIKVAPDGLGTINNNWMLRGNSITSFNSSLYLALSNQASGMEIWQMLNQVYIPMIRR